jgi:hypothetical protein
MSHAFRFELIGGAELEVKIGWLQLQAEAMVDDGQLTKVERSKLVDQLEGKLPTLEVSDTTLAFRPDTTLTPLLLFGLTPLLLL